MLIDLRKKDESKTQQNTGGNDYLANNRNISATNTSTPNPTHTKINRVRSHFMQSLMDAIRNGADDAIVLNRANQVKRVLHTMDVLGGAK